MGRFGNYEAPAQADSRSIAQPLRRTAVNCATIQMLRPMITFMISDVPAKIRCSRAPV